MRYVELFLMCIPVCYSESSGICAGGVFMAFFEWFFIRVPDAFERFSNKLDYGITVIKSLKNEHELFLTFRLEEFHNINTERDNGHIFLVGY